MTITPAQLKTHQLAVISEYDVRINVNPAVFKYFLNRSNMHLILP